MLLSMNKLVFVAAVLLQYSSAWCCWALEPAPISCNAAFSAPCARTNSRYLSESIARDFAAMPGSADEKLQALLQEIQEGKHNMDTGFYPFVFRHDDATCEAHGDHPEWKGSSIQDIFDAAGIGFSDAQALHERFVAAAEAGGNWVRYLWSDRRGIAADVSSSSGTAAASSPIVINSKLAFVTNLTSNHYIGVGYENQQLPPDVPCSAKYDSWCSITNVRSLVGAAQFRLEQAASLENFEAAIYDISFDKESYTIEGGFYPFLFNYDGRLKGHAILHDSFGKTLEEIFRDKGLLSSSGGEGWAVHDRFVAAAEAQQQGTGSGWTRYWWKDTPDGEPYEKIAYITKVEFGDESFYLGVGFRFATPETPLAALGESCSFEYNWPCAFEITLQLSSHSLSFAISHDAEDVADTFRELTNNPEFRRGNFYVFVYDFENVCVAHGLVPGYVGKTLNEVFDENDIGLDADALHDQFRTAASLGGGWVAYDWLVPGVANSEFQKLSYLFQLNIGGRPYYAGVGFNHKRANVRPDSDFGFQNIPGKDVPVPCSRQFDLDCSEVNARAILGQALGDLTLATSPVSYGSSSDKNYGNALQQVLGAITAGATADDTGDSLYKVNDFYVSVFSVDGEECSGQDDSNGSGCCLADGNNSSFVLKTWQQILDAEGITSVRGSTLHTELTEVSNRGSGFVDTPWSIDGGVSRTKKSYVAGFRGEDDKRYYVIAEHFLSEQPETCDACPASMECTDHGQDYCVDKPEPLAPGFKALIALFSVAIPILLACFWIHKKRAKARSLAKIQAAEAELRLKEDQLNDMATRLEESMQGMVSVLHDLPIKSPSQYMEHMGDMEKAAAVSAAKWYFEEDNCHLSKYESSRNLPGTNFIEYERDASGQLEHAHERFLDGRGFRTFTLDLNDKVTKVFNPDTGACYEIDFEAFTQKNVKTGFTRAIHRRQMDAAALMINSEVANKLPDLPDDIDFTSEEDGEVLLPVFEGQVIQVSKIHPNKEWLFGNVLSDPLLEEAMKQKQNSSQQGGNQAGSGISDALDAVLADALHNRPTSGWFPKCVTTPADLHVMRKLLDTLGGEGGAESLNPPSTWAETRDVRVFVPWGTPEYKEVADYFMMRLHDQRGFVSIQGIERIQNLPLWQSYSVKKQTLKTRDSKHPEHMINNRDLEGGLERRWLFHGTTHEVVPKIERQGFNRAFAGRNAVLYGKGVYFARDASYSSHSAYSRPDDNGIQRIFLCRVAVGDWCRGTSGQLTPDPKPHNNLELFDTTVDNVKNPSIFVAYHDAQAYPEYLVSFERND